MRNRLPAARALGVAKLPGHSLRWHKRSVVDGSGKCDAFATGDPADVIVGVIFELADVDKGELDRLEGLGHGYSEKTALVQTADGSTVLATLYCADLDAIDPKLIPYDWYKEHVQCGARDFDLPTEYRAAIDLVPAQADANRDRAAKERSSRTMGHDEDTATPS